MYASGSPSTVPLNTTFAFIFIALPLSVVIVSPPTNISPAVTLFTFSVAPPPPICDSIYALIARCVGTTVSLFAVNRWIHPEWVIFKIAVDTFTELAECINTVVCMDVLPPSRYYCLITSRLAVS